MKRHGVLSSFNKVFVHFMIGAWILMLLLNMYGLSIANEIRPEKTVLVLHSNMSGIPGNDLVNMGLNSIFANNHKFEINIDIQYLDLTRFNSYKYKISLADTLRTKYSNSKIDLVIAVGQPALDFINEFSKKIAPKTNIVFCAVSGADKDQLLAYYPHEKITGITLPAKADKTVQLALKLWPKTRMVGVISGASDTDLHREAILLNALHNLTAKIEIVRLSGMPIHELRNRISEFPSDSLLFFATYLVDDQGSSYVPRQVLSELAANSQVPIFGLSESHIGYGIVGGRLFSSQLQGKQAAMMGLEILSGKSASAIPIDDGENTFVNIFDWREIKRWNIRIEDLPPDSSLQYYQSSLLDIYRWYILGAAVFMLLEIVSFPIT